MNVLCKMRRLRFREELSIGEISRRLGVARNTVKGWLKAGISGDGLHPDAKGYALMAPVVEAAIRKAVE